MNRIQINPLFYYWIEDKVLHWYYAWARLRSAPANDNALAPTSRR
jgi:hypothetical protein